MAAISASLFGSFWVALGLVILLADVRAFRRAGPLRRKRTRVADLQDGRPAKLVGIVRLASRTAAAPLSGRVCAGWHLHTARKRFFRWRPLSAEISGGGFFLDDGTGEVFVPLRGDAHMDLGIAARVYKRRASPAPRRIRSHLAAHLEQEDRAHAYRCDERAVVDGMRIAVYGVFNSQPDQRPSEARTYRGRSYCFVAQPDADEGIHVSDDRATLG